MYSPQNQLEQHCWFCEIEGSTIYTECLHCINAWFQSKIHKHYTNLWIAKFLQNLYLATPFTHHQALARLSRFPNRSQNLPYISRLPIRLAFLVELQNSPQEVDACSPSSFPTSSLLEISILDTLPQVWVSIFASNNNRSRDLPQPEANSSLILLPPTSSFHRRFISTSSWFMLSLFAQYLASFPSINLEIYTSQVSSCLHQQKFQRTISRSHCNVAIPSFQSISLPSTHTSTKQAISTIFNLCLVLLHSSFLKKSKFLQHQYAITEHLVSPNQRPKMRSSALLSGCFALGTACQDAVRKNPPGREYSLIQM